MKFGNVARVLTIAAACFAAVGSATSNTNNGPAAQQQSQMNSPPPPQQMDPARALGLWRSTFGAVKLEADNSHGGLQAGAVQGVWMYQRQGQDVIGYFYDQNRVYEPLSKIAPVMRQAIVAVEDNKFYSHGALDLKGTIRAFLANQTSGGTVQGGSTLTQQYVKQVLVNTAALNGDQRAVAAATSDSPCTRANGSEPRPSHGTRPSGPSSPMSRP